MGVKRHPCPPLRVPSLHLLSARLYREGHRLERGWVGQAEPQAGSSWYPGHRCGSPNPASSSPLLTGIPHCRELPGQSLPSLPPALPAAPRSISPMQAHCWPRPGLPCQSTLSLGTRAGSSRGPCDPPPSRKDAVVSMSSPFFWQRGLDGFGGRSSMFTAQEDVPRSYHNKIALGHWLQGWLRTKRTKKTFLPPHAANCTWPRSDFPPSVPMVRWLNLGIPLQCQGISARHLPASPSTPCPLR